MEYLRTLEIDLNNFQAALKSLKILRDKGLAYKDKDFIPPQGIFNSFVQLIIFYEADFLSYGMTPDQFFTKPTQEIEQITAFFDHDFSSSS